MMRDGEMLLRAILANPEDDVVRLVYADYLEEQGKDERASYIRLKRDDYVYRNDPSRKHTPWSDEWEDSVCSLTTHWEQRAWSYEQWRHGFLEMLVCELSFWMDYGPLLVRHHPIQELHISDRHPTPLHDWFLFPDKHWMTMNAHHIPYALYAYFTDGRCNTLNYVLSFGSEAQANDALSKACLVWAKDQPISHAPSTKSEVSR